MDRSKIVSAIRGKFGNIVPDVGEMPKPPTFMRTGILSFDWSLGGGYPIGHITHLWGPDGGGKTMAMIPLALWMQDHPRVNGVMLYIATEPKVNPYLFYSMGVREESLIFAKTTDRDSILDGNIVMNMIRSTIGEVDVIVLDSVAGLSPAIVYDMESQDNAIGLVARLLSYQLPAIANIAAACDTPIILLNQQRAAFKSYGPEVKPFAGYALRHWISNSCYIRSGGWIVKGENNQGFKPTVQVNKNSFGPPRRKVSWRWTWDGGLDYPSEVFDCCKNAGLLTTRGGIKLNGVSLNHAGSRSLDDALERVREERELQDLLYAAVMQRQNIDAFEDVKEDPDVVILDVDDIEEPILEDS